METNISQTKILPVELPKKVPTFEELQLIYTFENLMESFEGFTEEELNIFERLQKLIKANLIECQTRISRISLYI